MANPISKSDIIQDGLDGLLEKVNSEFEKMVGNLSNLRNGYVQTAQTIGQNVTANSNNADALAKEAAALNAVEDGIKKVDSTTKMLTEDKKRLNEEARKYKKLTDDEKESVKKLSSDLEYYVRLMHSSSEANQKLGQLYAKNIKEINVQNKSYNELYATYNALKDALNKMTTEERNSTAAGKLLTEQAKTLRDTMNQLQQATGNYALNVGNYASAFNGLRFQTQQILREIPSAINVQQFFLAISNNIPMFAEALSRYNQALPEMKVKMASITAEIAKQEAEMVNMNALTTEYASKQAYVNALKKQEIELQALSQGGWKAILKSVVSWQTLLIAGLLLLRKIPDWIKKIRENINQTVTSAQSLLRTIREIDRNVTDSTSKAKVELEEINRRLSSVTRGTVEWYNIVARVNEITNGTLDATKAMPKDIEKVTEAYIKQAEQLAKNQFVIDKIAESANNAFAQQQARSATTYSERARALLGNNASKEDIEQLSKRMRRIDERKGRVVYDRYGREIDTRETQEQYQKRRLQQYRALFEEYRPTKTEQELIALWNKYYKPLPNNTNNGSGNNNPSEQEMNDQFWKAAETQRNILLVGYQKELADEKAAHLQQMQEQERANREMQDAVEENVKNGYLSRADGDRKIQELQKQNDDIMEGLIYEHHQRVDKINAKYAEMDRQVVVENELAQIELLDEAYKVDENNRRRRIKTIKDEEQSNRRITESVLKMREEIEKLQEKNLTQPESIEQRTKRIQELEKAIAKLQQQIDHTKQLSNYSSVGDIFRRNISVGASTQQSMMESILGKDAYSAFVPGSKEMQEAIEKDFDTWMQSAEKSLSTWYSTTMGYINDLISAYVDLANAKAEAAAEATEAAQEEYDKEKALLEAGYASRVEATWAEYQEKKAAQEKAEADAKAAAQAQKELNEISTAGNMIVAASNIWKTFSAMGPVGVAAAVAAITAMFGAFVQSKIKANEVSKYGEGGFEVLEGGSHASGHDIDLGVSNRRGRRMRAEGKEGLGIFSRRAMEHYGANNIEAMVNSVNRLEFEGNAAKRMSLERSVGMAVLSAPRTDLRRLENSVDKLVGYGSRSRTVNADGSVTEYRNNGKVTIKKG